MKLTRVAFILLVFLKTGVSFGQDTLSIYFKTGISKIQKEQEAILNTISSKYDLSDLDSVYFIGLADSIGDAKLNLKLSEKRAKNSAAYCKKILPETTFTKIIASGESTLEQTEKNRKVNIVFYFPSEKIETLPDTVKIIHDKQSCYNVDYKLLRYAHIRTVVKGRKRLTIIQARPEDIGSKEEYYYGELNKKGDLIIKPVKWKSKKIDGDRYITSLPAESFRLFRLFKITNPPCDTCHENLLKNKKLIYMDSSMLVERELMEAIELKQSIFPINTLKIRVPRKLVVIEDSYFIGCESHLLKWRKKGKKYYYSRLPLNINVLENITRRREFCRFNPPPNDCAEPIIRILPSGGPQPLTIYGEVGCHYDQDRFSLPGVFVPFVGLNFIKEQKRCRYNLLLAIPKNKGFNGAIAYQFPFINFPLRNKNPFSRWQKPATTVIQKYMRMYLGTALRLAIERGKYNMVDQDLHLGLSIVNFSEKSIIRYIYIQYGVMYDYIRHRDHDFNSIAQMGINFKLIQFGGKEN